MKGDVGRTFVPELKQADDLQTNQLMILHLHFGSRSRTQTGPS